MKRNLRQVATQKPIWKNEEGFTFLELITTLVIIGILVSAALARYIDISQAAEAGACVSNQVALETAQTLYYTDNYLKGNGHYADELNLLELYLQSEQLPNCPGTGGYVVLPGGVIECTLDEHNPEY